MEKDLQDLIREARRDLRRASGVPLTADEQAEEKQTLEIARMQKFLHDALGVRIMISLLPKVRWTEKGATAQFTVESHPFQLFKDRDSYRLSDVGGDGERELLNVRGSDPNFGRRLLVAIGDALVTPE